MNKLNRNNLMKTQDNIGENKIKYYLIVKLFIQLKIALGACREENSFLIMNAKQRWDLI